MRKITIKELAIEMSISYCSAQTLYADIKKEFGIKIVTISHVRHYLKIPIVQHI